MTSHLHAEFLHALADGQGDEFECQHESWGDGAWRPGTAFAGAICSYPDDWTIRRRAKIIRIGEMDVPEPMRVAPPMDTDYWVVDIFAVALSRLSWAGNPADARWLKFGMCHLTKEDAEQHHKALILVSGGTP